MPDESAHAPRASARGPLGAAPRTAATEEGLRSRGPLLGLGLIGLLACVLVLAFLASIVQSQERDALDTFASPFFHGLASPPLDLLMNAVTFLGSDPVIIPLAVVVAAALLVAGRRVEALFLAVVLGGSVVVNLAMKLFFHRPRPALPWSHVLPDYSFPSGHSMDSLALGLALALIAWRIFGPRVGIAAVTIAILVSLTIGISRIYLGYHYATDVIGGFLSAILWVAFVAAVFRGGRRRWGLSGV
ncbi:MAG TPA: phosphatase PAP2 family protein [Candidatus Dormibacteraeota bacterium]|nr:phosphatase PAP2 family protein [Candidatus Dormibacteraeota bacterium]